MFSSDWRGQFGVRESVDPTQMPFGPRGFGTEVSKTPELTQNESAGDRNSLHGVLQRLEDMALNAVTDEEWDEHMRSLWDSDPEVRSRWGDFESFRMSIIDAVSA